MAADLFHHSPPSWRRFAGTWVSVIHGRVEGHWEFFAALQFLASGSILLLGGHPAPGVVLPVGCPEPDPAREWNSREGTEAGQSRVAHAGGTSSVVAPVSRLFVLSNRHPGLFSARRVFIRRILLVYWASGAIGRHRDLYIASAAMTTLLETLTLSTFSEYNRKHSSTSTFATACKGE